MSIQSDFSLMKHEGYKLAFEKWTGIKSQLDESETSLQTLLFEGKPESFQSQKEKQVQAILDGQEPDDVQATEIWRENFARATQRRYLFIEALEVQKRRISEQRIIASKKIAKEVEPKYKSIIEKMALKWVELGKLVIEERNLRESLNDADIAFCAHFDPMPINRLGDPRNYNSNFSIWLIEAVERGYLSPGDVPKELKDAWLERDGIKLKNTI